MSINHRSFIQQSVSLNLANLEQERLLSLFCINRSISWSKEQACLRTLRKFPIIYNTGCCLWVPANILCCNSLTFSIYYYFILGINTRNKWVWKLHHLPLGPMTMTEWPGTTSKLSSRTNSIPSGVYTVTFSKLQFPHELTPWND